jgi:hypothetical protein
MPVINNYQSLQAGIRRELMDIWKQKYPIYRQQQEKAIRMLPQINLREATYAFKESLPFPNLWPYGMPRQYQTFKDKAITMAVVPYELTIPWSVWDERDDQLGDIRSHVQMAVERFLQLPDVLFAEYLNAAASLNPSLYNCYDGAALFSSVDGNGDARYGVTGGNIITGSGLTAAGLITDLAQVQERALKMVDPTASKPLFAADDVKFNAMFVIGPPEANAVLQKVSNAEMIWQTGQAITSETNWLKGTFQWDLNSYLTTSKSLYVIVQHPFWKPVIFRGPEQVESIIADMTNSDRSREVNENVAYASIRCRMGPFFPATIFKINND